MPATTKSRKLPARREPEKPTKDTGYTPHRYQLETHHAMETARFGVLVCHRRWGKTVFAINQLGHEAAACDKPMGRFGYVAPYLKQAKQIAFQYLLRFAQNIEGWRKNESEMYVELPNGARITLFGADNAEAMRGNYFDGIVCDEVADFDAHVWPEIIRPALADRGGWALFIGTPKGIDAFSELYEYALTADDWHAAMYRADETDLPWLPKHELELLRATMSEQAYRREMLCDFTASADNTLIKIDSVSDAMNRRIPGLTTYEGIARVLGVDVARFGGDSSVICKRQGPHCEPLVVLKDLDNMTLATVIAQTAQTYKPDAIFVDGGRGEGVIDRLRQLGFSVVEVQFGGSPSDPRYQNKRSEMWDTMRQWIEDGGLLPQDSELKTELVVPTYGFTPAGKFALEPKEKIKERLMGRSTDRADAIAVTFAAPVMPKPMNHEPGTLPQDKHKRKATRPAVNYTLPWERKRRY